jgi:hypothetical protein
VLLIYYQSQLATSAKRYAVERIQESWGKWLFTRGICISAEFVRLYWNAGDEMAEQRTYEWFADRWGKITMSKRIDILLGNHVHDLNNLLKTLKWEQFEATPDQIRQAFESETRIGDNSPAMSWGKRHEEEAITHYELSRNVQVIRCGFKVHPLWPALVGDSTDFIEYSNGALDGVPQFACEVKCPYNPDNHKKTLRFGMQDWHNNQTQGHMEVHDLSEGKFVSYDPRHPIEEQQIYVQTIYRDPAWTKLFREKMEVFDDHFRNGTFYEHAVAQATDGIPSMF